MVRYYFDLIRIFSEHTVRSLNKMVKPGKIDDIYCSTRIFETDELLKFNNLNSCLEIRQATDEKILYLKERDLSRHTISRIEIARDIDFDSRGEAEEYTRHFQKNHYMRYSSGNMRWNNTLYMGKEEDELTSIYNSSYVPVKFKFGRTDVFHDEFVIIRNKNVKRILKINGISELRTAEEYYKELYDKYIVKACVNKKRFNKYFQSNSVDNIEELVAVISYEKNRMRELIIKNRMLNLMCDKRMKKRFGVNNSVQFTKKEQLIINQGIGYWTVPIK